MISHSLDRVIVWEDIHDDLALLKRHFGRIQQYKRISY